MREPAPAARNASNIPAPVEGDADSRHLTQAHVAARLDRPQSFIAKYEGGERRLDVIEFMEVAEAIGFDPGEFVGRFDASDDVSHDGGTPCREAGGIRTGLRIRRVDR